MSNLAEQYRRRAMEAIQGRKSFEEYVGRKSTKPLTKIEIDPWDMLSLLDEMEGNS